MISSHVAIVVFLDLTMLISVKKVVYQILSITIIILHLKTKHIITETQAVLIFGTLSLMKRRVASIKIMR